MELRASQAPGSGLVAGPQSTENHTTQGGKDTPGADTLQHAITSEQFLGEIFSPANMKDVWVSTFGAGPESWFGRRFGSNGAAYLRPDQNNYFAIGMLGSGETRRSSAGVVSHHVVFADDIGTKVNPDKWADMIAMGFPAPRFKIETSPNNQTWVWVIDTPVQHDDEDRVRCLRVVREALGRLGLSDPLPDDARYIRMPCGVNSKQKYLDEYGFAPLVSLVEHAAGVTLDIELAARILIGSDWKDKSDADLGLAAGGGTSMAGALVRSADLSTPEPIMQLGQALDMVLVQSRPGVVEALCPNIAAHTSRADTGFAFLGNGLMECTHAHCGHLRTPNFQQMMCEQFDREQDGREALGMPLLDGGRTAKEFLARATFEYHDAKTGTTIAAVQQQAAAAVASQAAAQAGIPLNFRPTPFQLGGSTSIPPREWLYGKLVIRGHVSLLVAPGGLGKSSLTIVEAIAMATGKPLLGDHPVRKLRVCIFNGEDPYDELNRRITATCRHYGVTAAELGDRLIVISGRDLPLKIARGGQGGSVVTGPAVDALVELLRDAKVDVLIIDPLVTTHDLPENDNTAMNAVIAAWREVVDRAGCAVLLVHHVSKAGALDGEAHGIYGSRGAGALIDGVRSARFLVRMSQDEAERFGILAPADDYRRYFRVQNGKSNLAPAESAVWRRTVGVPLNNGSGLWPDGDVVGVVEPWLPPSIANVTTLHDLDRVQMAVAASLEPPRLNENALDWVGYLVADILVLDIGVPGGRKADRTAAQNAARAHVRQLVSAWLSNGALLRVNVSNSREGRSVPVIAVGKPANEYADNNNEMPTALLPEAGTEDHADAA